MAVWSDRGVWVVAGGEGHQVLVQAMVLREVGVGL